MVFKSEFYGGSRILTPLGDMLGFQIDQINFLMCQLVALGFAFPFRGYFSAEKVGVTTRHIIEVVVGVLLTVFCFGYQIWHLLFQSLVSYVFMAYGGSRFSHGCVFVFALGYLAVTHIYRQIYDYGGYTLDITGPMMIQTQRLTSLAFALHDGRYKEESKLSPDQKVQAVKKLPNMLEYLSYMFAFHGIMIGPVTFYNDYIAFIDGTNYSRHGNFENNGSRKHPADGLNFLVFKKLLVAAACCAGMLILPGLFFPPEKLDTPEFYNMTILSKIIFVVGVMTLAKQKYYFVWVLCDAVNNAAGFGFSGYDAEGNPKWDLTDNVDILGVELSTSLKINIDSWNTKTLLWLRRVVYDRAPFMNTLCVFGTSAFWHGFYPGYYITFFGGAFCIIVARKVRRKIRPMFQTNTSLAFLYDAITFTATRLANAYLCFPFLVLEFYNCFNMYMSMYFWLHILTVIGFIVFTFLLPSPRQGQSARSTQKPNNELDSSANKTEFEASVGGGEAQISASEASQKKDL